MKRGASLDKRLAGRTTALITAVFMIRFQLVFSAQHFKAEGCTGVLVAESVDAEIFVFHTLIKMEAI